MHARAKYNRASGSGADGTVHLRDSVHVDGADPVLVDGDRVPTCITVNDDVVWKG